MEAVAMDFSTLSRRELQALCKLNGVRANMTNLAMAEALQSLEEVDGIDQIGTTLCIHTPGKSAMKSVLKAIGDDQQQQKHGSPLPRGRRVSVMSPEAIRMDVEDGEEEMKRDLVKDIVRTPGVALRSTSRRPRATPAPIPTLAPGTLRRSQRSAARKAAIPVEVEVSNTKRSTRRTARSKVMIDLDQEEEGPVAPEEVKVQAVEPKGIASDEKCDDPEEEKVTRNLKKGNSKLKEPEQDEEAVSPVEPIVSADRSCDDLKVNEVVVAIEQDSMKPQQEVVIDEDQEHVSAENVAPVAAMENLPILGVLSKVDVVDTSTGGGDSLCNLSSVLDITDEINRASEDKKVSNEDSLDSTHESADAPNKVFTTGVSDNQTEEADDRTKECSEEDDIDQEDVMQNASLTVDTVTGEIIVGGDSTDVNFDSDEVKKEEVPMLQETGEDINDDDDDNDSAGEEDDFSANLSSEFENAGNFSGVETKTDNYLSVKEGIHAAAASPVANSFLKSPDTSAISEYLKLPGQAGEVSQQAAVTEVMLHTIVKSMDAFTIADEVTKKKEADAVGAKKKSPSLRKLKSAYKQKLIAANEKKRLALSQKNDNVGVDC